ncbi:bactofilin family protein [Acetobacter sacchari]|nr:polymer-forming cytoskeletal protein [Acetobacter sacchari]
MFRRRKPDESQTGQSAPSPSAAPAAPPSGARPPAPDKSGAPLFPPQAKDTPSMGRAPFPPAPGSTPSPNPVPAGAPGGAPAGAPGPMAQRPQGPAPRREEEQRRTLVVGRGISVQGSVQDAERLVVEGTVESSMIVAKQLSVAPGGLFRGGVEVEDAEIAGTVDGTLTVRGSLTVSATGRLLGKATCKRLRVEDGGQITGQLEMLTDGASPSSSSPAQSTPTPAPASSAA